MKGWGGTVPKPIALVLMLVFLGGCGFTSQGTAIKEIVFKGAAKAGDAGLENAERFICEIAPIGAVKKRYQGERAKAYNTLCDTGTAEEVVK